MEIVSRRIENVVVKEESAGYQDFFPHFSHNVFKVFFLRIAKVPDLFGKGSTLDQTTKF